MNIAIFLSAVLEDPLAWMGAWITILVPALSFLLFLWFFRPIRLTFLKNISCPEKKHRVMVEFDTRVGEVGPYRDVRSCSLLEGEKGITCRKTCLSSPEVLEAPLIAVKKQRAKAL